MTTDIHRPAPEVFTFLDDVENNPMWLSGMRSASWDSPPPRGVGSRYSQEAHFLGKTINTSFEVTRHEPGRLVTIQSRAGSSFPIEVTREVVAVDEQRCKVVETVVSDPSGVYRIAGPLLAALVHRRIARDYRRLRDHLEAAQHHS